MWPTYRNIGAACLGAFILVWQTVLETHAQAVLVAAALALIGVPATDLLTRRRINGKGDE